ncbi:hypothetical protein [Nocardia otitidiscaviarum]|uniref:DUF1902 domain-containing protein n=1 Tax=Nocardia otitidiscaviarum TaxID=1823 RepID=A0A516NIE4_9NOCA|nr:hypothetical protein [Nocardia otitidiscaviarum]MBF6177231.1 hypothetical protein [Nocardia otitidiscaviarum]MCP9618941.1 hypothetical protein [Nocardia otitidiscaviarum]QDP78639.1 hypothetical protein FOH10_07675 [Nocardia otitidiscaviarum]
MQDAEKSRILLPTIQVRWSPEDGAFVAWSEQCPELTYSDPASSLAALDGLIDAAVDTGC